MRAYDYLGPVGPLSRNRRYEHRPAQLEMAQAVEEALERDELLLVEAGTGTGKTLAYLVPAVLAAAGADRRIIISTGTRALQNQLVEHDLRVLRTELGLEVNAVCLKGVSNYLCRRRFGEFRASADAVAPAFARSLPLVDAWQQASATGDASELDPLAEDDPIWSRVLSSTETRIGPRCDHYDQCFVTWARQRAEEAQVVIVNHHLFFADLASRDAHSGGILPDYDAVIFDEAHQIEGIATQFFGTQVSTQRLQRLINDARRSLALVVTKDDARLLDSMHSSGRAFFRSLRETIRNDAVGRIRIQPEQWPVAVWDALGRLHGSVEAFAMACKRSAGDHASMLQLARRAESFAVDLDAATDVQPGAFSHWMKAEKQSVVLGASPVDVSDILREHLWHRLQSAVLTSATLAVGESFRWIRSRLGLDCEALEKQLASSFDFSRQAALYVPRWLPDPNHDGYLEPALGEIKRLVALTEGGALILCTSLRKMRELSSRFDLAQHHPILVQGQAPKNALLEQFRESGRAVLFATASFWEGVDIPGYALRLVIVDKLPFEVHTDPLVEARCALLEERGESPFMKYLLPTAALSLKQGFGRLIRTATDRGIVAVLDSRLARKSYGKILLRSLPPARRCQSIEHLTEFWLDPAQQLCAAGPGALGLARSDFSDGL